MLHFDNYDVCFIVDQHALSWILLVRLIIRTIDITDSEPTRLCFYYLMQQISICSNPQSIPLKVSMLTLQN